MAKPIDPRVVDLNTRIFAHRLVVKDVLRRASVPPSTWTRWKAGADARRATLDKVDQAITQLINEQEALRGTEGGR